MLITFHDPSWRHSFPPDFDTAVFTDSINPSALGIEDPQYVDTDDDKSDIDTLPGQHADSLDTVEEELDSIPYPV